MTRASTSLRTQAAVLLLGAIMLGLPPRATAQTKIAHTKYMFHHLEAVQIDELIDYLGSRREKDPPDPEPFLGLAAAHAAKGEVETAMTYVEKAVDGGMPVERFLVGPRGALAPLNESARFKRFLEDRSLVRICDEGPIPFRFHVTQRLQRIFGTGGTCWAGPCHIR